MTSPEMVDEFVQASGQTKLQKGDIPLLRRYVENRSDRHCRQGCDACESSCPAKVPIAEVLRARMYAADYGDHKLAQSEYAKLGSAASPCTECSSQACVNACPFGLAIPGLTRSTAEMLGDS